ncbi:MAG: HDIG domain-containing protein [Acidobacteria bacterium]|nr:HDIG domain-containing protein [Acidobacteriota bacterium]
MPKAASTTPVQKLTARFRRFSATLSDQAVVDAGVGIFIIVILSLMLLRSYQRNQIDALPAGAVAASDILAPEDIRVADPEETERLRAQALAQVLPVFDYKVKAARDVRGSIEQMFHLGQAAEPGLTLEDLNNRIQQEAGIFLDDEQLAVLVKHRFNYELEKLMVDHLESVMGSGVVSSRSQIVKYATTGILRRDTRSNTEMAVTDLAPIRDLITARAQLRSEKIVWPADYDARERKLFGEILGSLIVPNLEYNETETEDRRTAARQSIAPITVSVAKGEAIVKRGETVTAAKAAMLEVASRHRPTGQRAIEFAGTVVIVMMLVLVLWQYLIRYQNRHLRVRRHFLLQIATFLITLGITRLFFAFAYAMSNWVSDTPFNSQMAYQYLAPVALGAALVTILTDDQAAFVCAAILSVFIGIFSGNIHLAVYALVSSVAALHYLRNCRDRTELVSAGMWIGMVNAAAVLALDLLGSNEFLTRNPSGVKILSIALFDAACGFASGVLSSMFASILLPLLEWLFQITTNIKLLELSNLNLPLLKQLAERAPGTYHHSIMVGLLASKAAEAIGGDALFTRVACLYHDIGKSIRPTYFIENQTFSGNPHDNLEPKMSSIVLANHVKQGIELAKQYKLPPRIIGVIPQHHGTGLMKYFYFKAKENASDPESKALEKEFRYPGPKPQTKEAGIIMIADSVEAASRTVQEPTIAKFENMVSMIITRLRDDGQLDDCDITQRELSLVAQSFVKTLMGIQHHRISYPGYDFNRPTASSKNIETNQQIGGSEGKPKASTRGGAKTEAKKASGD